MSSLKKNCNEIPSLFLICNFVSFLLRCVSEFWILCMHPLSGVHSVNICFQPLPCLFTVLLAALKLAGLIKSCLSLFLCSLITSRRLTKWSTHSIGFLYIYSQYFYNSSSHNKVFNPCVFDL